MINRILSAGLLPVQAARVGASPVKVCASDWRLGMTPAFGHRGSTYTNNIVPPEFFHPGKTSSVIAESQGTVLNLLPPID